MNRFITLAVTGLALGSLSIVSAQGVPGAPTNLRIVTGSSKPDFVYCGVPPLAGGAHAYFDALVRRAEHACNWSLRDQAMLDSLTADRASTYFKYQFGADSYGDPQDAAKFYVPPSAISGRTTASIPTTQQLRMSLPRYENGSLLITWDWYWGPEFRLFRGGMNHYKMFKVFIDGHPWWTMMANLTAASLTDTSEVTKVSDEFGPGTLANAMTRGERVSPSGPGTPSQYPSQTYPQYHGRWVRYWLEVKLLQPPSAFTDWSAAYCNPTVCTGNGGREIGPNPGEPQGRWHMVSLWTADEQRGVQRLLYKVPMNWKSELGRGPHLTRFDFEVNTSQSTGFIGPFVGYGRNVVVLRNYPLPAVPESDTTLFQRPRR